MKQLELCQWFIFLGFGLSLAGCATHRRLPVTRALPGGIRGVSPSSVLACEGDSTPAQPFDVLGQVTISLRPGAGRGPVDIASEQNLRGAWVHKTKEEADAMGGNALAGIYIYKGTEYDVPIRMHPPAFITGLAASLLDSGQMAARPLGAFVVGVAPLDSGETDPAIREFARKWSFLRTAFLATPSPTLSANN